MDANIFYVSSGVSHLYASATSRNPGPLDTASIKNEDDANPRSVSVTVDDDSKVNIWEVIIFLLVSVFIWSKIVICFSLFRLYTSVFKAKKIPIGLFYRFGITCLQTREFSKLILTKVKVAMRY